MVVGSLVGAIAGIALGILIYGILIGVVGNVRLGMEVDGFSAAFLAAGAFVRFEADAGKAQ